MGNNFGYMGKILKVDLSKGEISHLPTDDYAERFIGGRGFALKTYWDMVPASVKPFDPENVLMFFPGPLTGFAQISTSRCQVATKSPSTPPAQFSYSNIGGHWGVNLKFSGYDGLIVVGKAEKPVYLVIRDDKVEIKDAAHLWMKSSFEVRDRIKKDLGRGMRVLSTGPAGDNMVAFASILADQDASASSGVGAVMGSKNLKAIAVQGTGKPQAADPERLKELAKRIYDLQHFSPDAIEKLAPKGSNKKREVCWGCSGDCQRVTYKSEDGMQGKFICQSSLFYGQRSLRYYGKETETAFFANKLCDAYGMDTAVIEAMILWIVRCGYANILTDEDTGIPISKAGSLEFIQELTRKIAYREGVGDVLANGIVRAADMIGNGAPDQIKDIMSTGERFSAYGPRMLITTGILYAMEPRQPIQQLHEVSRNVLKWVRTHKGEPGMYMTSDLFRRMAKRMWGSEIAADFSTYEGKAMAAKRLQDRQYAKESLILCDFAWPIEESAWTEDHMGDLTLESQVFSAVTGREVDEDGLNKLGERIFNLQRAVLARDGHVGRENDRIREIYFTTPLKSEFNNPECLGPGKDGELLCKLGTVVDRQEFEDLETEYYGYRDWDPATGLQTKAKLEELGLGDLVDELRKYGAVADDKPVKVK